jgi:hypothetical protein
MEVAYGDAAPPAVAQPVFEDAVLYLQQGAAAPSLMHDSQYEEPFVTDDNRYDDLYDMYDGPPSLSTASRYEDTIQGSSAQTPQSGSSTAPSIPEGMRYRRFEEEWDQN